MACKELTGVESNDAPAMTGDDAGLYIVARERGTNRIMIARLTQTFGQLPNSSALDWKEAFPGATSSIAPIVLVRPNVYITWKDSNTGQLKLGEYVSGTVSTLPAGPNVTSNIGLAATDPYLYVFVRNDTDGLHKCIVYNNLKPGDKPLTDWIPIPGGGTNYGGPYASSPPAAGTNDFPIPLTSLDHANTTGFFGHAFVHGDKPDHIDWEDWVYGGIFNDANTALSVPIAWIIRPGGQWLYACRVRNDNPPIDKNGGHVEVVASNTGSAPFQEVAVIGDILTRTAPAIASFNGTPYVAMYGMYGGSIWITTVN